MTAYFVTGTDTGVGKTTVGAAILRAARSRGLRVAAVKPAESGCEERNGRLVAADGERLAAACAGAAEVCYRLRDPVAPNVAAERDGVTIELPVIREAVNRHRDADLVLVEGAGGLLVPLTDELDMAALAGALGLPLLVVARDALGTINHTLLTVEVARGRGLRVAGIVLSGTAPGQETAAQENRREIERRLGPEVPVLGILPFAPAASDEELGRLAATCLDLDRLFHVEQSDPWA